jgi:hypothetical protein
MKAQHVSWGKAIDYHEREVSARSDDNELKQGLKRLEDGQERLQKNLIDSLSNAPFFDILFKERPM